MNNKYDIGAPPSSLSLEILSLLQNVEVATVGHWRLWGLCHPSIQCQTVPTRVVGRAVTLALPGPCSTLLHYAIDTLRQGDILVIDRLGDSRYACWGGGVSLAVKMGGGIAGVIDGPCTDTEECIEAGMPVWATGVSPVTTRQYDLGGRLNRPVSVGGCVVMPGDVVICDATGVLILPPDEAEAEDKKALSMQSQSTFLEKKIRDGQGLSQLFGAKNAVEASIRQVENNHS